MYSTYTENIRYEYSHVPLAVRKEKRAQVMRSFLDVEVMYFTEEMRALCEAQARCNISAEVRALTGTAAAEMQPSGSTKRKLDDVAKL